MVTSWKIAGVNYENIVFPDNHVEASKEGQVFIPANLLRENSATGEQLQIFKHRQSATNTVS